MCSAGRYESHSVFQGEDILALQLQRTFVLSLHTDLSEACPHEFDLLNSPSQACVTM